MMFKFVIRYLGFLKHIPLLPWIADALMMIWNFMFNRALIRTIEDVENEVSKWAGVTTTLHKYGGIQFNVRHTEIGHVHSNGVLDVLLSVRTKQTLLAATLAEDHHTFKKSGWVTFYIRSRKDTRAAIHLLSLAYKIRHTHF